MILKNLMEDKQLDLNRPFLSVRQRRSPLAAPSSESEDKRKTENSLPKLPPIPTYKSELKSGPIRNPGTVPFLWEQTPGRPKDESKSQTCTLQRPPIAPKLPPGRILHVKQQALGKGCEGTAFTQPQQGNVPPVSQNASSLNKNVTEHDSSKQENEEKEGSDSEDDDEAYVDACDTLSRSESIFLNCSVSGLSGLDGPDVKPVGTFSDPQTRDFMMGRFLPAAKAMASETPHYTTRKQPVAREQPRQVNMISTADKRQSLYQHRPPTNIQHYAPSTEGKGSEDDSDEEPGYSSAKICGLLPQFCLLNPVPGLRMQGRAPVSSVRTVHAKPSYASSYNESEKKHYGDAVREQKSIGGRQTADLHNWKTKPKSESKQITYNSNGSKLDGSSLYRRLQGNGASPHQNEFSLSPLHEENGYIGTPEHGKNSRVSGVDQHEKGRKNFRDILATESTEWESGSGSPVVEKTLYIDSVHVVKSVDSNSSCCSDTKEISDYRGNDFEILEREGEKEETHSVDSSLQDIKHLDVVVDEKEISQPKSLESADSDLLSSSGRSNHDMKMDKTDDFRRDQNLIQNSVTLTSSKMAEDETIKVENQQHTESDNFDTSHGSSHLLLPPPLPKSPSESWLSRTLTAVSSRNQPSLGMRGYNRTQASKTTPSLDPKWETIVKTSKVHHGHLRFSEELLTPIAEA